MNKRITETEFTKMVHDKMREANRFKEYERIPQNRIGGDYWNTYWTIRYMLRTMTDILGIQKQHWRVALAHIQLLLRQQIHQPLIPVMLIWGQISSQ